MADVKKLRQKAQNRGIGPDAPTGGYERHVVLCTGKSCGDGEGQKAFKHLRKRIKAWEKETGREIYCTATDCLQFCRSGPLAVVYPEGTWYHSLSVENCDRVMDEHLVGGKPVADLAITANPLFGTKEENREC